jgi:predicted heme/steroid binding protein
LRKITREELKRCNGANGSPIYIAYKGKVYDVTLSPLFFDGVHFDHFAGDDLTEVLQDAPHGEEVFDLYPCVGELTDEAPAQAEGSSTVP